MDKIAVVTGVTGMDGSYISDLLLEKGYKVYGLVRRSSNPSDTNIKHLLDEKNFEVVQGDITDAASISRLVQTVKPHEFYNFAAQSQVGISFMEPTHTFKANAESVINILESIRLFSPATRLYQACTSEQFGKSFSTRTINGIVENYQDENTPMVPQSPYAAAKLAAFAMVGCYRRGYNIFGSCGILFNHEGCRRSTQFVTRKITDYIGRLVQSSSDLNGFYVEDRLDRFPKLKLGNINSYRDWGESQDYVRAAYLMLQQDKPDDYLIATGETHTVQEFLEEAFSLVKLNWKHFVEIDPKLVRAAEVDFLRGDSSRARKILGWEPKTTFKGLVKMMVDNDVKLAFEGKI